MQKDNFLVNYKITYLFNYTLNDILLPSDGYTQFQAGEEIFIVVPISPNIAFMLYQGTDLYDEKIVQLQSLEYVLRLNKITIDQQNQRKQGYILASNIEQLEQAIGRKKDYEKQSN